MYASSTSIQIETWPIARLLPYARNPRKNDQAVDRMCASIREFGFKIPCLVRSDGEVVDGHLRLKAAHKLGITEVPVLLCDEWTPAQVKAFRLLVNRSVTWAGWDEELLALELQEIQGLDFDGRAGARAPRTCFQCCLPWFSPSSSREGRFGLFRGSASEQVTCLQSGLLKNAV